ncbi:unnamed protein product, partial [Prorocentrum cordatum]
SPPRSPRRPCGRRWREAAGAQRRWCRLGGAAAPVERQSRGRHRRGAACRSGGRIGRAVVRRGREARTRQRWRGRVFRQGRLPVPLLAQLVARTFAGGGCQGGLARRAPSRGGLTREGSWRGQGRRRGRGIRSAGGGRARGASRSATVDPHNKDERLSKVTLASFPLGPSSAAFTGRAPLTECWHGLSRPLHPYRASLLYGLTVEAEVEGAVKMAGPPPEAPLEERQAGTWLDATVLRIHANFMVVGARRPGSADDVRGLVHFSRVPAEHAAGRLADHYSVGQSVRVRMVDAGAREESSDIRQMWMGGPPDLDALERARAEGLWLNATVVRVEQYGLHVQVVPPGSQSCHQAPSQMPCRITAWCTSRRFNTGSGVQYEAQSGLLHGQPARPRRPRASQGSQPDALPYHGLVHISEIKYGFVQDISAVAEVGDTVRVRVTGLDRDTGRVNLSMRASLEIFEQFGADEWIDATVFNVSDRVVEVQARLPGDDSGVASGIVPSRELRAGPVQSAMGAAEVGDTVRVRLINATGRFGPVFSMKPRPDVSAFAGVPPEALLPAFVVAVLDDSHIFVSVPPPTDAGEPAEGKVRGVVAAEYQPGQMVQVRVSDVNVERGLLTLTLGGLT